MGVTWDGGEDLAFVWRGIYDIRAVGRLWFAIPLAYPGAPLYAKTATELAGLIRAAEKLRAGSAK